MNIFEMKKYQYQSVLSVVVISIAYIFPIWIISQQLLPVFQLPSKVIGINLSIWYLCLNMIFFLGYLVTSLYLIIPPIEKKVSMRGDNYSFGNVEVLWGTFLIGIAFTMWNVCNEWNSYVFIQITTLFILSLILIIWFFIDKRKTNITLKILYEKKPENEYESKDTSGLDDDNPDSELKNDPS